MFLRQCCPCTCLGSTSLLFELIIPSFLVHVLVLLRGLGFFFFLIQLFKLFSGNSLRSNGLGFDSFTARAGSVPGWRTKIPQAAWCSQKKKLFPLGRAV